MGLHLYGGFSTSQWYCHILTSVAFVSASSSFSWASFRASEYLSNSSSVDLSFFCSAARSSSSLNTERPEKVYWLVDRHLYLFTDDTSKNNHIEFQPINLLVLKITKQKQHKIYILGFNHTPLAMPLASVHKGSTPGPDLFASVLRRFLVWLGLLSSVQCALLVELQHLHLFLDGIHGCLSSGVCAAHN